jgi:hypothetical protein
MPEESGLSLEGPALVPDVCKFITSLDTQFDIGHPDPGPQQANAIS